LEKKLSLVILVFLLISACSPGNAVTVPSPYPSPTNTISPGVAPTSSGATSSGNSDNIAQTSSTTPSPVLNAHPFIEPVIHDQPGDLYETIFRIPIDNESGIQYEELPGAIFGPNGIAISPDGAFIVSYHTTNDNQLLYLNHAGDMIKTVDLDDLGISFVADIEVRDNRMVLLEITGSGQQKIHRLSADSSWIDSEVIPEDFPSSSGRPLASGEVSIGIDCESNTLMEVEGGYKIYRFSEVLKNQNPADLDEGYPCNGKYYSVLAGDPSLTNIRAGEVGYETRLTSAFGGLSFLDVFEDGSFYVARNDVVNQQVMQVDQTIHFVGADGVVRGAARVPLSEFYYPIIRNAVIHPSTGEVFVLLPRPDSLDVVRLNFYRELPPLIDGGISPVLF